MIRLWTGPARERLVVHGLLWSFGSDVGAKLAVLTTAFIAVRALSPALFGQYVVLTASALLAAALWDAGVTTVVTRELAAGRTTIRSAIARVIRLRCMLSWLWLLVYVLAVASVIRQSHPSAAVVALFAFTSLFAAANAVALAILRGRLQFRSAGLATTGGRWITAALSLIAFYAGQSDGAAIVLAAAATAGEAVLLVLASVFCIRLMRTTPSLATSGNGDRADGLTLRRSLPYAANSVMVMLYNRFDVVIVATLASQGQLERYAPASRLQDALYIIPATVGTVAMPLIAKRHTPSGSEDTAAFVKDMIVLGLAITLPVALVGAVFAPQITDIVLGSTYRPCAAVVRILVWFLPLAAIQAPLLAALVASGRAADTTKVFAAAFGTAMIMHLALDRHWGAMGGGVATLSRDVVAVPVTLLLAHRAGLVGRQKPGHRDAPVSVFVEAIE